MFSGLRGFAVKALVGLVAFAGVAGLSFFKGVHYANTKAQAAQVASVKRAIDQYRQMEAQDQQIAAAWEKQRSAQLAEAKSVDKQVNRYVESRHSDPECFDARGLRVIARIASGHPETNDSGQPQGQVPRDAAGSH